MIFVTRNTTYTLVDAGDGAFLLSGNQKYCPLPTLVTLHAMPEVGQRVLFETVDGPRKGKATITTHVVRIA